MSESLAISYAAKGVTYFDDNARMAPVTHYAPLYPLVVSALGFAGIDPLEGVRWLNALLFAFNIMLAAWIVFRVDSLGCCIHSRFFLGGYGVSHGSNTFNRINRAVMSVFRISRALFDGALYK
ncbi:MAG TPA: hypothetical protein VFP18_11150 [Candidatus Binatia bacterium]|nr:hypothetical protein [Candidatus Binatia bacterium]